MINSFVALNLGIQPNFFWSVLYQFSHPSSVILGIIISHFDSSGMITTYPSVPEDFIDSPTHVKGIYLTTEDIKSCDLLASV